MAVRHIRRAFATPFIVTLAGSSLAACGPKPLPKHDHVNPPGPHSNPPAPDTQPPVTEQTPPPVEPTTDKPVVKNDNPPPPQPVKEPAKYEQRWTVSKFKDDCTAMVDVQCPKPEKGKPVMTCNPPPPIKYACPADFKDGDTLKIILRVGATDCFVETGPIKCPPNAKCNPPPPRKIACPER